MRRIKNIRRNIQSNFEIEYQVLINQWLCSRNVCLVTQCDETDLSLVVMRHDDRDLLNYRLRQLVTWGPVLQFTSVIYLGTIINNIRCSFVVNNRNLKKTTSSKVKAFYNFYQVVGVLIASS